MLVASWKSIAPSIKSGVKITTNIIKTVMNELAVFFIFNRFTKKSLTGIKIIAKISATKIAARYGSKMKNKSITLLEKRIKKNMVSNVFLFIGFIITFFKLRHKR